MWNKRRDKTKDKKKKLCNNKWKKNLYNHNLLHMINLFIFFKNQVNND